VLKRTGRIGIARVVIRTREYLSAVMPRGNALVLLLLRYPQELVDAADYKIPEGEASQYRISPKEIEMAEQLIESMSDEWQPSDYRDEFRDRLRKVIEKRMKSKGVVSTDTEGEAEMPENATTNVVDFMSLLQKSLASNKRTPAKKAAKATKTARKAASKKAAAPKKKAAAKKTAKRAAHRKTG
jgi:DNA end-binding protein Ku